MKAYCYRFFQMWKIKIANLFAHCEWICYRFFRNFLIEMKLKVNILFLLLCNVELNKKRSGLEISLRKSWRSFKGHRFLPRPLEELTVLLLFAAGASCNVNNNTINL